MKANYHTHTYRCHHARNCEWEYVENAIAGGLEILGFSDHAPYPYPEGYQSGIRMKPEQLAGYIETVQMLARRYADQIEIHCGLEAEYFPDLFPAYLDMLRATPGVEYLILGQHYLYNEFDQPMHTSRPTNDEKRLVQFVDQVIEGLATGRYLYVCHPDVLNFTGDLSVYKEQMRRLCRAANELKIPLELNLQGYRSGAAYPRAEFWALAGEENCTAIIGTDAHQAKYTCDHAEIATMQDYAKKFGLKLIDQLPLKEDFLK